MALNRTKGLSFHKTLAASAGYSTFLCWLLSVGIDYKNKLQAEYLILRSKTYLLSLGHLCSNHGY
jgi:hypothetical protein